MDNADVKSVPMDYADVVIVGGGIIGSAVAYFLSIAEDTARRRVVIVERDTSYAEASTARSAGGLRQQFTTPENIAMSHFTASTYSAESSRRYSGPTCRCVAFREKGYLLLGAPGRGKSLLARNVALQRLPPKPTSCCSRRRELTQRFAWLATDGLAAGAFGASGEGRVDPASLAALMRTAARERGVAVIHDRVTGIDVAKHVKAVVLASGSYLRCAHLVNAAGAWAGELAALAGVQLPVEPRSATSMSSTAAKRPQRCIRRR